MIEYLKHIDIRLVERAKNPVQLITILRRSPLKRRQFIQLSKRLGLSREEAARIMGVSIRTFHRQKPGLVLSFPTSETTVKLAEILETGLSAFDGDEDAFLDWLNSEVPAIAYQRPRDLLTSLMGIELVKEELLKIEHGIY